MLSLFITSGSDKSDDGISSPKQNGKPEVIEGNSSNDEEYIKPNQNLPKRFPSCSPLKAVIKGSPVGVVRNYLFN